MTVYPYSIPTLASLTAGVDGKEPTKGEVRNERTNFTSGQARNKPIDYESVFRCTLVPMGIVNGTGLIVDCNESFLGVSGHNELEVRTGENQKKMKT